MSSHQQVWVKVNAPVDGEVSEIISVLNSVEGLQTLQSCQGDPGLKDGYVYFCYGDWQNVCRFIFEKIGPALKKRVDEDVTLSIEATNTLEPMAELRFKAEAHLGGDGRRDQPDMAGG